MNPVWARAQQWVSIATSSLQKRWLSAFVRFLAYSLIVPFCWASSLVFAEVINVKSAVVKINDEALVVDAEFDFTLTAPLEAALVRGTPLFFIFESEVTRARAFWFDEGVTTTPSLRRIAYVPLTSSYRVDAGGSMSGGTSYSSLDEALRQIRVVRGRALVDKRELRNGARYDVSLRLRLDTTQLPKPLQVNTLVSREWTLASEWYRVVVSP